MHLKLLYEKISTLQPKKLDAMIKMKKKIEFEFFSFNSNSHCRYCDWLQRQNHVLPNGTKIN